MSKFVGMGRFLGLLAVAAFLVPCAAVASDAPIASCGAVSPLVLDCRAEGFLPDGDVSAVALDTTADLSYVGRIVARATTSTGSKEITCKHYTGSLAVCIEVWAGEFLPGQPVALTAHVEGFEPPLPPGVGNWSAQLLVSRLG